MKTAYANLLGWTLDLCNWGHVIRICKETYRLDEFHSLDRSINPSFSNKQLVWSLLHTHLSPKTFSQQQVEKMQSTKHKHLQLLFFFFYAFARGLVWLVLNFNGAYSMPNEILYWSILLWLGNFGFYPTYFLVSSSIRFCF